MVPHGTTLDRMAPTSSQEDERRVYGMKIMELQKQLGMDDKEPNGLQSEHVMYLRATLDKYRNCLLATDTFNIKVVFRLTSLWFMLLNDATTDAVNAEMLKTIKKVSHLASQSVI
ncbi:unnamed protein product [Closterium sp. NIES-64]|nr:unnamed protein product [Closterium sp. NIES-64]